MQSLKSRGIRFPGRDNESLAPIFTPARSVGESAYSLGDHLSDYTQQQFHDNHPIQSLSPEQAMEAFDVARNSIELLSTVLSSSPKQDALKVTLLCSSNLMHVLLLELGLLLGLYGCLNAHKTCCLFILSQISANNLSWDSTFIRIMCLSSFNHKDTLKHKVICFLLVRRFQNIMFQRI